MWARRKILDVLFDSCNGLHNNKIKQSVIEGKVSFMLSLTFKIKGLLAKDFTKVCTFHDCDSRKSSSNKKV